MRRLLWIIPLLWCLSAHASITLIAHAIAGATSGTSGGTATTSAINCTGASLLVAVAADFNFVTDTIADSTGLNTWIQAGIQYFNGTTGVQVWYVLSAHVSSSQTFSSTGEYTAISASCWSGVSALDTTTGNASAIYPFATGSLTPAVSSELFVTGATWGAVSDTLSIGGSFSALNQLNFNNANSTGLATAYYISTTSSAQNPTWSDTGSARGSALIVAFEPVAGASGHCSGCDISKVEWTNAPKP